LDVSINETHDSGNRAQSRSSKHLTDTGWEKPYDNQGRSGSRFRDGRGIGDDGGCAHRACACGSRGLVTSGHVTVQITVRVAALIVRIPRTVRIAVACINGGSRNVVGTPAV
jgi:hypothetical protein